MARPQLTSDEVDAMRVRLVDAALEVYRREGLEAVSFRRLADAVRLSHTLPYRYFENKDALLAEMRRSCFAEFEAHVIAADDGTRDPRTRINAMTAAYVGFVKRRPAHYQLMFSTEQPPPTQFPALLAARRSLFEHAVGLVRQAVEAGQLRGDARRITHLAWVSVHGLMSLHVANQLVHGFRLEQLIEPLVETVLGPHATTTLGRRPVKRSGTATPVKPARAA